MSIHPISCLIGVPLSKPQRSGVFYALVLSHIAVLRHEEVFRDIRWLLYRSKRDSVIRVNALRIWTK
jgi:hypothetical protein